MLAGDREVPFQVGGAAGEVAGQAAGDQVAVGAECFGARDFGRVGVFRGCAGLPGPDFSRTVAFFALVDDDGVLGEEADDRFDVAIAIAFEVAGDDVGEFAWSEERYGCPAVAGGDRAVGAEAVAERFELFRGRAGSSCQARA